MAKPYWLAIGLIGALSGCATRTNYYDPLESVNRPIHRFNDVADRNVFQPVTRTYTRVTPEPAQAAVRNFFGNLEDPFIALNNLLQGKGKAATEDALRFTFNSTLGIFGLIDIATPMGLTKHDEDFGQTLGKWGVGSGPYLVIPLLGPRTLRDTSDTIIDVAAGPLTAVDDVATRNSLAAARAIDTRAKLLAAGEVIDEAALDPYSFTRDAYLQRRYKLIYDDQPPGPLPMGDPEEELFDPGETAPAPAEAPAPGGEGTTSSPSAPESQQ